MMDEETLKYLQELGGFTGDAFDDDIGNVYIKCSGHCLCKINNFDWKWKDAWNTLYKVVGNKIYKKETFDPALNKQIDIDWREMTTIEFIGSKEEYPPKRKTITLAKYNKFKQYKDIEDDIGIDLATKDRVERADKIYSKFYDEYIDDFTLHRCGVEINDRYDVFGNSYILLYKNYGKTWALTKEELE